MVDEEAVSAMTWRAIQEVNGLDHARDFDLITTLMQNAVQHGYGFEQLESFYGARHRKCFGFFRTKRHYAGIGRVQLDFFSPMSAIIAQTTGEYEGVWVFALDSDASVLMQRDSRPVEEYRGLEGPALINAVLASAFTETLPKPSEKPRRSWPWSLRSRNV